MWIDEGVSILKGHSVARAKDGEAYSAEECPQCLRGKGVEPVYAQRIRAGDASSAESSCSCKVPCQCVFFSGGTAITFPWAVLGFHLVGKLEWQ